MANRPSTALAGSIGRSGTDSISRSSASAGTTSASAAHSARYRDFFALFEDFSGYVEFFLLQDLVTDDCCAVRFFMPFDDFNTSSVPRDSDAYKEYRHLSIEFIKARNRRIGQHPSL